METMARRWEDKKPNTRNQGKPNNTDTWQTSSVAKETWHIKQKRSYIAFFSLSLSRSPFIHKKNKQWTSKRRLDIDSDMCTFFTCSGVFLIHRGYRFPSACDRGYWMNNMSEVANRFHCCALSLRHWLRTRSKRGTTRFPGWATKWPV